MSADQWKEEGDCQKCRRQSYCNKDCKAHKNKVEAETVRAINKAFTEVYLKIMTRR